MLQRLGIFASAIAFPLLCLMCVGDHAGAIQSTLRTSVEAALSAAPIAGVQVRADGRDITLLGNVKSEEEKAKAGTLAALLPGVRSVDNELTVQSGPSDAARAAQVRLNQILRKKIEFQSGSDIILPASTPVLQEALKVLKESQQVSVRIEGHTDNAGPAEVNRELSRKRAQAVVNWFATNGIAAQRMKFEGFGPDRPIGSNDTEEGRALNRRVEIIAE
jgi:outer membrane protein OmpA-like peptidoglycan-associated protein